MEKFLTECFWYIVLIILCIFVTKLGSYLWDIEFLINLSFSDTTGVCLIFVSLSKLFNYFKNEI